jgi:hypothetical protein
MAVGGGTSGSNGSSGFTYTGTNTWIGGGAGGGGGGSYSGALISNGMIIGQPFVPVTSPDRFGDLLRGGGPNKLTQLQIERLMQHEFIPVEDGHPYCLLCFALDVYRTRHDHDFVIHEE